jgi:hypothetical protein
MGKKTTICLLILNNGFEIVGTSACVNPNDYNYCEGCFWSLKQALDKVDEFDGYYKQCNTTHMEKE